MNYKIKELREKAGLSQMDLCGLSGIDLTTLRALENNRRDNVYVTTLIAVSLVLKVDITDLYTYEVVEK